MKGFYSIAFPTAETDDIRDIQTVLNRQSWYPGDTLRSAELLKFVAHGIKWVREDLEKKGILDFINPTLRLLVPHPDGEDPNAMFFHHAGSVYVDARRLSEISEIPRGSIVNHMNDAGEVMAELKISEYMFLGGVEEADHSRFDQEHPGHFDLSTSLKPNELYGVEYDAQDHEFEALQKKLQAAESLCMTQQLIDGLRSQISAACNCREKKNLNP